MSALSTLRRSPHPGACGPDGKSDRAVDAEHGRANVASHHHYRTLSPAPQEAIFIVVLTYKVPITHIDAELHSHRQWLEEQYRAERFVASGSQVPRVGGVIITRPTSETELRQVLAEDPFARRGYADYELIQFVPTMSVRDPSILLR
ncbi:YciI family protein [Leifsonia sp. 2MCAF36]|uniref:YciI family protein n=1 Tax=Leifsonia sp. 2MCAF36 TaxID=3232988 RepID=UPI003F96BD7E